LNDVTNCKIIYTEIFMDNQVAQTDDSCPRNFLVVLNEVFGKSFA